MSIVCLDIKCLSLAFQTEHQIVRSRALFEKKGLAAGCNSVVVYPDENSAAVVKLSENTETLHRIPEARM